MFTCPTCGREFPKEKGLTMHIRIKHPELKSVPVIRYPKTEAQEREDLLQSLEEKVASSQSVVDPALQTTTSSLGRPPLPRNGGSLS